MKLKETQTNSDKKIWIIETLPNVNNSVVLMLPNFTWEYPTAWWDYVEGKGWLESYGKWISPFTETLAESWNNKIVQINYPNDWNFYFVFKQIIRYLEKNNFQNKNIVVYWQSMGGKTALYLSYFLLKQWFNLDKIIVNSSVIDKETISVPFIHLPSSISATFYKILKYIPSKYLVWILSVAKDDPLSEVNFDDLIRNINNLKWYNLKYKQIKSRLDFMKEIFNTKVSSLIRKKQIPILAIRSKPPVENSKDDGMVKHIFIDKLRKMFPNQVENIDVSSWHCQVPEKNKLYATALAELFEKTDKE